MENGFELVVTSDEGDRFVFNIHSLAEEFFTNVNSTIGTWLDEAEHARASYIPPVDPRAYDARDPKHPDWHSVHSDLYDLREKG